MSNLNENKVWVTVEDLTSNPEFLAQQQQEFIELPIVANVEKTAEEMKASTNRRDFLKYVGFGLGAATVASCEAPIKKAIPFVVKPDQIIPGVANYFASAFVRGGDFVPVLVKTREGRPIKIEGNPSSSITKGGTSARAQAHVLSLYDTNRLQYAAKITDKKASKITWAELDAAVKAIPADTQVRIVSHTNISPTLAQAVADFKTKYVNTQHIQYDPFSCSALLEANAAMFKKRVVPNYRFDKAMCVVGIECDFLGTWISPVEYTNDYIQNRKIVDSEEFVKNAAKKMSQHTQFESAMSMTGSNADNRVLIKPSEQAAAIIALYNEVASKLGQAALPAKSADFAWKKAKKAIELTAKSLVANKGKSLVVCGINDVNAQMIVNGLNTMLESYGNTILWTETSNLRKGDDKALSNLIAEMKSKVVGAVFILDANPAFDIAGKAAEFAEGLAQVPVSVSMSETLDETAELCKFAAPEHHGLEAWSDANPKDGHFYLIQPTIRPLYETRQAGLSFLTWAGMAPTTEDPYYDYLAAYWKNNIFTKQSKYATMQSFWDNSLHDGFVELPSGSVVVEETTIPESAPVVADLSTAASSFKSIDAAEIEVTLFETIAIGSGQYANNPWLQEMPDPVMRTTWDNFISVPLEYDGDNNYKSLSNLNDGDIAKITVNGQTYELPVVRQFGQMQGTVSIALGYGRTKAGKAGNNVGKNLFPIVQNFNYFAAGSKPEKVGKDASFACVQTHHTYGLNPVDADGKIKNAPSGKPFNADEQVLGHRGFQGSLTNRSVFFQSNANRLEKSLLELKGKRAEYQHLNDLGLYPDHKDLYTMGHHWAMTVDLNSCTGCGACVVACMAENNVPVVGKYEVAIAHEMTWLRIDRYFYGAEDTPNTAYMPMMCQHCDNAPCENVCPVAATNHSSEGLNQMTYNRCIGTRYCANNCPYKVRRFNWLDYTSADLFPANEVDINRGKAGAEELVYYSENITRMVLNPDVTVRSRGVIEKCSFCVQRLQEGKLKAKSEGRKLKDQQDIQVACAQACPTGGIVFGDRNDKSSQVYKIMQENRIYIPLEETNVRSSVHYSMKVVNRNEEINGMLVESAPKAEEKHS
jgi:MoCo/4Fe-4S cofactor protein with predicted Tat translocation signal